MDLQRGARRKKREDERIGETQELQAKEKEPGKVLTGVENLRSPLKGRRGLSEAARFTEKRDRVGKKKALIESRVLF